MTEDHRGTALQWSRMAAAAMSAALLGALVMAASATAQAPQAPQASLFDFSALNNQALVKHIRPGYRRFAAETAALKTAVDKLCTDKNATDLMPVLAAFRGAALAWAGVEHLKFGPVIAHNRYERILFWPDPNAIGARQITRIISRRDAKVLNGPSLAKTSVAVQGLGALERLLFARRGHALAIVAISAQGRFNCRYAMAITANLKVIARDIDAAWHDGGSYARAWLKPGGQNAVYGASRDATRDLVQSYVHGLWRLRKHKLEGPLGLARPIRQRTIRQRTKPQFALSNLSIEVVIANARALLHLIEEGGFARRLAAHGVDINDVTTGHLNEVVALGRQIEKQGAGAFSAERPSASLIAMGYPLKAARRDGGAALAKATGLVLDFSAAAGD